VTAAEYATVEEFYADRPERLRSGEADYGVHWKAGSRRDWPQWRVSYVQATGEVYAVQLSGRCPVRVLGVVPPDPDTRHETGCYDGETYYRTLDRILDGWAELDAADRDVAWVEQRLAGAAAEVP